MEANRLFNEGVRLQIVANKIKSQSKLLEAKQMYQAAMDKYQEAFEASGRDSRLKSNVNFVNGTMNLLDKAITTIDFKTADKQSTTTVGGLYEQASNLQAQANQLKQNQQYRESLQKLQEAKDKFLQGLDSSPNDARYKTAVQNIQKLINEMSVKASQSSGNDEKAKETTRSQTTVH
jgi:tetratricopeptide (TPR) repeat protein